MDSSLSFGQRRPAVAIGLTTLVLVILLAAAGTAVFMVTGGHATDWTAQRLPVALAFAPVALWLALRLARSDMRALTSLRSAVLAERAVKLFIIPVIALVVQALEVAPDLHVGVSRLLSCILLACLVGFVEEGIYRGLFMHWLAPRGLHTAVWVSTAVFSLTHAINAFGAQSWGATVLQIAFAGTFGFVAAHLRLATGSLLPLIAWHAMFDTLGFLGTGENNALLFVNCVMLTGFGAWLAVRARHPKSIGPRPHEGRYS